MCPKTDYCPASGKRVCTAKAAPATPSPCTNSNDAQCSGGYCNTNLCADLLADGTACSRNSMCATGYCHASNSVCTALPASGATCGTGKDNTDICAAADFCYSRLGLKNCVARASANSPCNVASKHCLSGFYCDQTAIACKPVSASQGHSCVADLNCAASQYCSASKHCVDRKASQGTGCTADNECVADEYCDTTKNPNKCTLRSTTTAANTCANDADGQCKDLYCNGSACAAFLPTVNACTRNTQCKSGYCPAATNICTDLPATGQACGVGVGNTQHCKATDFCSNNICVARATLTQGCDTSSKKCAGGLFCHKANNFCSDKISDAAACVFGTQNNPEEMHSICSNSNSYCSATQS